jgi:hypothetical protein
MHASMQMLGMAQFFEHAAEVMYWMLFKDMHESAKAEFVREYVRWGVQVEENRKYVVAMREQMKRWKEEAAEAKKRAEAERKVREEKKRLNRERKAQGYYIDGDSDYDDDSDSDGDGGYSSDGGSSASSRSSQSSKASSSRSGSKKSKKSSRASTSDGDEEEGQEDYHAPIGAREDEGAELANAKEGDGDLGTKLLEDEDLVKEAKLDEEERRLIEIQRKIKGIKIAEFAEDFMHIKIQLRRKAMLLTPNYQLFHEMFQSGGVPLDAMNRVFSTMFDVPIEFKDKPMSEDQKSGVEYARSMSTNRQQHKQQVEMSEHQHKQQLQMSDHQHKHQMELEKEKAKNKPKPSSSSSSSKK